MASKPMTPEEFWNLVWEKRYSHTAQEKQDVYANLHALYAKYGQHLPECGMWCYDQRLDCDYGHKHKCTCGFEEVKA